MKILLFGKDGQLGWELQRSLAPLGELVALGSAGAPGLAGDFRQPEEVATTVRVVRPDLIVNAAAYTAVDRAEADAATAMLVNATAPGVLATEAQACGALLVHYSTDYVFDGSGDRPWKEEDTTGPLSVYGASKLAGELAVVSQCERHLVVRTSWAYASRGGNFAKTMLRLAAQRERLSVVDDQVGAPTGADLLADVTAHMVRAFARDTGLAGIYHVAATGATSWNDYARLIVECARRSGYSLKAEADRIDRVPSERFPTAARRPKNSRLDTSKVRQAFHLTLPPWQAGVIRMLEEVLRNGEDPIA